MGAGNLGSELWGRTDSVIPSVRVVRVLYVGPCEFKRWHCLEPARIQVEFRNGLGIPGGRI